MGGHDFLDHMLFRMTCVMITYLLSEVMLCCRKCIMGVMYWWSTCLQDGISYKMLCFTERHVLLEVMSYLRVGIIGGHVLLFKMSYWCTCLQEGISYRIFVVQGDTSYMRTGLTGGGSHVLHEGMSYRWTCLTVLLHVI